MAAWLCRNRAARSRAWKRRVPRSAASRSSRRASHSACARLRVSSCASSSMKAWTMPSSLSALSWSRVGWVSIAGHLLVEVGGAADVVVRYRRSVRGRCRLSAIEAVLEDRVDGTVGARPDLERPAAGGLEPLAAIGLGQPQDADAGAEALLGVRAFAQDDLDQRRGVAADRAGLPPDALRSPVGIAPVA